PEQQGGERRGETRNQRAWSVKSGRTVQVELAQGSVAAKTALHGGAQLGPLAQLAEFGVHRLERATLPPRPQHPRKVLGREGRVRNVQGCERLERGCEARPRSLRFVSTHTALLDELA